MLREIFRGGNDSTVIIAKNKIAMKQVCVLTIHISCASNKNSFYPFSPNSIPENCDWSD
jgi:hypothetical protein